MGDYSSRIEQAIETCKKAINGVEDEKISTSSLLLMCKKIARLVNDNEGQQWLNYEYGGYPRNNEGLILLDAWTIATNHGRSYMIQDKNNKWIKSIFTELCEELETAIEGYKNAMNNFTTQGFSVSGEMSAIATSNLTNTVTRNTNSMLKNIELCQRRLTILKAQYYDYAVRWSIKLQFGNTAKSIFEEYQERVDNCFTLLSTTTLQKLNAINNLMDDGNPEHYAQVIASCRRLWSEIAKTLFNEVFPEYKSDTYKTLSGKEIDVSGDHNNNKLSAVIEKIQSKASKNTLVGSEIIYLVDWIEQINSKQSAGVHSEITREQAIQCIIHTYIALGDILSLKSEYRDI